MPAGASADNELYEFPPAMRSGLLTRLLDVIFPFASSMQPTRVDPSRKR
jgi:hypothetical protein